MRGCQSFKMQHTCFLDFTARCLREPVGRSSTVQFPSFSTRIFNENFFLGSLNHLSPPLRPRANNPGTRGTRNTGTRQRKPKGEGCVVHISRQYWSGAGGGGDGDGDNVVHAVSAPGLHRPFPSSPSPVPFPWALSSSGPFLPPFAYGGGLRQFWGRSGHKPPKTVGLKPEGLSWGA